MNLIQSYGQKPNPLANGLNEVRINLRANYYSPKSVKTTMIYTHVLNRGLGVKSPLD